MQSATLFSGGGLNSKDMKEKENMFKTPKQQKKEARDRAIYSEWCELTSKEGNSKMAVANYLSDKHKVSLSTIWVSIKSQSEKTKAAMS